MIAALHREKKENGRNICPNKMKGYYLKGRLPFWAAIGLQAIVILFLILPSLALAGIPGNKVGSQISDADISELVIIDSGVETHHQLASRVKPGLKVHILHNDSPAVVQITEILAGHKNLEAIHLFSHGAPGKLTFTNGSITSESIRTSRTSIASWGRALQKNGDILLYGCEIAAESGLGFVQALADTIGADVAASTDKTGHVSVNADLDLEFATGKIETPTALVPDTQFGPLFIFDWTTVGWSPTGPGSMPRNYPNVDSSGIDVSISVTGNTGNYQLGSPYISNSPGPDTLLNYLNFANQSQSISVTYTFSTPVYISNLTIMDIDGGSGRSWHDRVQVTGSSGGSTINPSNITAGSNVVVSGGNTVSGNGSSLGTSNTTGWASFAFQTQQVDSITVVYGSGPNAPSNPAGQGIWIGDIDGFDPTLAVISSFFANIYDGQVVINWSTASEIGTVGFHLRRMDEDTGKYVRVNEKLLPGLLVSPEGGTYRFVDRNARPGNTYTYQLVEKEANGDRRTYGPFTVTVDKPNITRHRSASATFPSVNVAGDQFEREAKKRPKRVKKARREQNRELMVASNQAANRLMGEIALGVNISVNTKGLYHLSADAIAQALGVSDAEVTSWVRRGRLALTNQGLPVAFQAAPQGNGISFYGEDIDSPYTDFNVYQLTRGKGKKIRLIDGTGPDPGTGRETFTDLRHVEEDHWALTGLYDNPEDDYWVWDYIVSGDANLGSKDFVLPAVGLADTGQAELAVHLKGGSATATQPDHHVEIMLNGTIIGEGEWDGTAGYDLTLPFDNTLLNDGDNTVTVTGLLDTGADHSIFYVNSLDLTYRRYYRAVNDQLLVRGDENEVVTVDGFTAEAIQVFDVTDPWNTRQIKAVTIDGTGGNHRVSFVPDKPQSQYLVLTNDTALSPLALTPDWLSTLRDTENQADYLIIAPEVLMTAAQRLADHRQGRGLMAMVVDLQNIYNEFNNGIANPEAIHDFLSYAYHNWLQAPRYVVLAGEGDYDYKDNQGYEGNLVPPILVSTPDGLFASDNQYADVEGFDGVPDLIIGRLPVLTPEALDALVNKIIAYENAGSGNWTGKVLMLADDPDGGGNFPVDSDDIAQLITPAYTVDNIYLSETTIGEARQQVLDGINQGAFLVNFIGHAGLDRLAQEGMLITDDVNTLSNGERLPFFAATTCVVGRFEVPGYNSLGEELVLHEQGGAVAVWAPTGLSINARAKILNRELFRAVFNDEEKVIGEAVLKALEEFSDQGGEPYMLHIYNLLGDPALQLR